MHLRGGTYVVGGLGGGRFGPLGASTCSIPYPIASSQKLLRGGRSGWSQRVVAGICAAIAAVLVLSACGSAEPELALNEQTTGAIAFQDVASDYVALRQAEVSRSAFSSARGPTFTLLLQQLRQELVKLKELAKGGTTAWQQLVPAGAFVVDRRGKMLAVESLPKPYDPSCLSDTEEALDVTDSDPSYSAAWQAALWGAVAFSGCLTEEVERLRNPDQVSDKAIASLLPVLQRAALQKAFVVPRLDVIQAPQSATELQQRTVNTELSLDALTLRTAPVAYVDLIATPKGWRFLEIAPEFRATPLFFLERQTRRRLGQALAQARLFESEHDSLADARVDSDRMYETLSGYREAIAAAYNATPRCSQTQSDFGILRVLGLDGTDGGEYRPFVPELLTAELIATVCEAPGSERNPPCNPVGLGSRRGEAPSLVMVQRRGTERLLRQTCLDT